MLLFFFHSLECSRVLLINLYKEVLKMRTAKEDAKRKLKTRVDTLSYLLIGDGEKLLLDLTWKLVFEAKAEYDQLNKIEIKIIKEGN